MGGPPGEAVCVAPTHVLPCGRSHALAPQAEQSQGASTGLLLGGSRVQTTRHASVRASIRLSGCCLGAVLQLR